MNVRPRVERGHNLKSHLLYLSSLISLSLSRLKKFHLSSGDYHEWSPQSYHILESFSHLLFSPPCSALVRFLWFQQHPWPLLYQCKRNLSIAPCSLLGGHRSGWMDDCPSLVCRTAGGGGGSMKEREMDHGCCSYVTGVLYPLLFGKEWTFLKSVL